MSRLIIKNLPNGITEKRLRELFSKKGQVTDVQLKYTKDGKFRKFGFVGYQTEQDAAEAIAFFHNTCVDTSRINVELCAALGAETKPQAWSKYAKDSSSYKKLHGIEDDAADENANKSKRKNKEDGVIAAEKKDKKKRLDEIFGEHKNDPKFIEFMKVHGKANDIWDNDVGLMEQTEEDIIGNQRKEEKPSNSSAQKSQQAKKKQKQSDDDDSDGSDDDEGDDDNEEDKDADTVKLADQSISDLDYLKSLKDKTITKQEVAKEKKVTDLFTIKIREIPFKTKRKDIIKFFKPVKAFSIRLPTRKHGFCYVGFKTEKEFKKAMLKNRSFLNGKQVILIDFTEKNKEAASRKDQPNEATDAKSGKNSKWSKQEEALKSEEDISESGRIFFRNLSYTVNEEQLQELFEKYGPVTDISLPIDPVTRKIKGFGTVTFVMPEHAVRAFSELDGSTFQGRLLHLIPGKSRETDENVDTEGMSYKQKKELELKKTAGSAHNWNTLFMGSNAVANTLAKSYQTSKEQILDVAGGGSSAAVRLALGETEMIIEMRKFLESNDVVLDAFNQAPKKRSKTVILVKNLPFDTQISDLQPLFAKFGLLGRIVLPPSGVTALIEFLDSSEAKKAFSKLAYTKFKNMPLYLEWAPENTFKSPATKAMEIATEQTYDQTGQKDDGKSSKPNPFTKGSAKINVNNTLKENDEEEHESYVVNDDKPASSQPENGNANDSEADDTEPEPGTTLFLRNLKFTTQTETIREHFRHIGKIHHIQIATKKDPSDSRRKISLGYGFIQFKQKASAENALKTMQTTMIDGNTVELKRSDRTLQTEVRTNRKSAKALKQTGSKILVRNIPFQATINEVRDLFKAFGELKSIRIPKKMTPGEDAHRGFGFVDFVSKSDAKKAFEALSHSTHLYGRRLVLEWAAADEDIEELRKRTAEQFHASESVTKRSKKAIFDASNISKIAPKSDDEDD